MEQDSFDDIVLGMSMYIHMMQDSLDTCEEGIFRDSLPSCIQGCRLQLQDPHERSWHDVQTPGSDVEQTGVRRGL